MGQCKGFKESNPASLKLLKLLHEINRIVKCDVNIKPYPVHNNAVIPLRAALSWLVCHLKTEMELQPSMFSMVFVSC